MCVGRDVGVCVGGGACVHVVCVLVVVRVFMLLCVLVGMLLCVLVVVRVSMLLCVLVGMLCVCW